MFILLLDEPCLFVFDSELDVQREVEPPDAEDCLRAAFDENAVPYRLEWPTPNRRRRLFGVTSISFGHYRLVPAGPPNRAALIALLEQHDECTDPPEARATLIQLLHKLRSA